MNLSRLRWTVSSVAFAVLLFGAYLGLYFGDFLPTFSCRYADTRSGTCFMMTIQRTIQMLLGTIGGFARKDMMIFLKQLLYFSLLVMLIGRAWCGWICPLGFFQDVLYWIGRKLRIGYVRFSKTIRNRLVWIKWGFMFVALLIPLWVAFPVFFPHVALNLRMPFCQLCPGKYILPLLVGNPDRIAVNYESTTHLVMSLLGLSFSVLVVLGAVIKNRFWCRFCPLGLILSWFRKISFFKLMKDDEKCTRCEICYNICPMDIHEVFESRGRKDVTFPECHLCLKCIQNCPETDALKAVYLGMPIYRSSSKRFFKNSGTSTAGDFRALKKIGIGHEH